MKKVLLTVLVIIILICNFNCFATSSPTLKGMIYTNPPIPFKIVENLENTNALNPVYELFGSRIASKFAILEALDLDVQDDWGIVEFKFIENFSTEDTVIAVFDNGKEFRLVFLEYENGFFPIDFSLIPSDFTRMYIISDYER